MIKRTKIDTTEERRILTNMILSTAFLSQVKDIANAKLFKSSYSQIVVGWVLEFFNQMQEAPGKNIEDIYIKNKHKIEGEEDTELIAEYLTRLSQDYDSFKINNVNYSVKNAIIFFKLRSVEYLAKQLTDAILNKDAVRAEKLVAEYKRVDKIKGAGINFLENEEAIKNAFTSNYDFLFQFPGELGKCIGMFDRSDFVAFMGAPKKGKTWWLIYTAVRSVLMGWNTVFISLEMTENPLLKRFWQCFTGEPIHPEKIDIPTFIDGEEEEEFIVENTPVSKKGINPDLISKHLSKYRQATRGGGLRILTFPSFEATVSDVEDALGNLEYYEGFVPDTIIIDYADILRPENGRMEVRHQLDIIWKQLRGMGQKREAMMVTATQTGRKGIDNDAGASDLAEDIRKLAHVTKLIVLNQNEKEKIGGILRVKSVAQREGVPYNSEAVVLECRKIGRPFLNSKNIKNVNLDEFKMDKK